MNHDDVKMKLLKTRSLLFDVVEIWKGTHHKNDYYPFVASIGSLLYDCDTRLGLLLVKEIKKNPNGKKTSSEG